MSTLEKIEKIQNEILKNLSKDYSEFVKLFENASGINTKKFIEKFIDWYINDKRTMLFKMLNNIIDYDRYTFFWPLGSFIEEYFYGDSIMSIIWIKEDSYVEFSTWWWNNSVNNVINTIPEHLIASEEDKTTFPVVVCIENPSIILEVTGENEVSISLTDSSRVIENKNPSLILEAMEKYENKKFNHET